MKYLCLIYIVILLCGCSLYKTHNLIPLSYSTEKSLGQTIEDPFTIFYNSHLESQEFVSNNNNFNDEEFQSELYEEVQVKSNNKILHEQFKIDNIYLKTDSFNKPGLEKLSNNISLDVDSKNESNKLNPINKMRIRGFVSLLVSFILIRAAGILEGPSGGEFNFLLGCIAFLPMVLGMLWLKSSVNNKKYENYIKIKAKIEKWFSETFNSRPLLRFLAVTLALILIASIAVAFNATLYLIYFMLDYFG